MNRWWPREVLRFVDAWACREGTPEDDEDAEEKTREEGRGESGDCPDNDIDGGVFSARLDDSVMELSDLQSPGSSRDEGGHGKVVNRTRGSCDDRSGENKTVGQHWVELDFRTRVDEELGQSLDDGS